MVRSYFVYILASHTRVLNTGMTGRLVARVYEHRTGAKGEFTRRYRVSRLVYYESYRDPRTAAARERQIKGWTRRKRIALVEQHNPLWVDLAEDWFR